MFEATLALQALINGASVALVYILVALGLTLIFSIMGIINFAHGEFYMLGGFAAYYFAQVAGMNYVLMLAVTFLAVCAFGFCLERLLFEPLRAQPLSGFIASLGLLLVLQAGASILFGVTDKRVDSPLPGVLHGYGLVISRERLFVMMASAVLIGLLYSFLRWSKQGLAVRAAAQESEAAAVLGINVNRISGLAFGVGCALAAAAGALLAPVFYVTPTMGAQPLVKAFIIVILGGMGSLPGAVAGGALLGVLESIGPIFLSAESVDLLGFGAIVILLLVRPTGLVRS
jgi:branched-chain amino acid transport system permease protein